MVEKLNKNIALIVVVVICIDLLFFRSYKLRTVTAWTIRLRA